MNQILRRTAPILRSRSLGSNDLNRSPDARNTRRRKSVVNRPYRLYSPIPVVLIGFSGPVNFGKYAYVIAMRLPGRLQ